MGFERIDAVLNAACTLHDAVNSYVDNVGHDGLIHELEALAVEVYSTATYASEAARAFAPNRQGQEIEGFVAPVDMDFGRGVLRNVPGAQQLNDILNRRIPAPQPDIDDQDDLGDEDDDLHDDEDE